MMTGITGKEEIAVLKVCISGTCLKLGQDHVWVEQSWAGNHVSICCVSVVLSASVIVKSKINIKKFICILYGIKSYK